MNPALDTDGYPTADTIETLRQWPASDVNGALDFLASAWHWPEFGVSREISAHEGYVLHAEPADRFLRLATGGWSGNEELISVFREKGLTYALAWRLSTRGGLHIFQYLNKP